MKPAPVQCAAAAAAAAAVSGQRCHSVGSISPIIIIIIDRGSENSHNARTRI